MHKSEPYINNTTNTSTNAAHLVIAIKNGEIILAILRTLSFSASFRPRWYTLNLNGPNKTPQINACYNKEIDDCVESKCGNQPSSNTKLSWYHCSQPAVPGFLASLPKPSLPSLLQHWAAGTNDSIRMWIFMSWWPEGFDSMHRHSFPHLDKNHNHIRSL